MKSCSTQRAIVFSAVVVNCFLSGRWTEPGITVGIPDVQAHSYIEMSLENMVKSADRVVTATPLASRCVWEEIGGTRRIVTYHDVRVDADIIGKGSRRIWVRTLGGVVDDIGQRVSGAALLIKNSPFLMFLASHNSAVFSVVGMEQGSFPMAIDDANNAIVRARRLSGEPVRYVRNGVPVRILEGLDLHRAEQLILSTHTRINRSKSGK